MTDNSLRPDVATDPQDQPARLEEADVLDGGRNRDVVDSGPVVPDEHRAAAERLASLVIEQAPDAIVVCDEDGRVIRAGQAARRLCNGSPLLRRFADAFPLRTGAETAFLLAAVLHGETLRNVDVTLDRQGRALDLILNASALLDGRRVLGCIITLTEITERQRAAEERRASDARYGLLIDHSPDGIVVIDPTTHRFLDFNETAHRQLGYSREEFACLSISDIDASESVEDTRARIATVVRDGQSTFDTQQRTRQGDIRHVQVTAQVSSAEGRVVYHCVWRDITEQKRTEAGLIASELRYRRLFESAHDGILILDAETGKVVDVNPFLIDLLGFSREEFLDKKVWDLGFFKDVVASEATFLELQQRGYVRYGDMALETRDGRRSDVEFVSNVYRVNGTRVIQCNVRDITERKRAEETLRESEQRFRAYVEHAPDGVFVIDKEGFYQDVNPAACRLMGYSKEELVGMHASQLVPEEAGGKVRASIDVLLRDGSYSGEFTFVRKDGSLFVGLLSASRINEGRYLGFVKDITDRKRAEEERRVSAQRQSLHVEQTPLAVIDFDLDGRIKEWNPAACAIFGFSREEAIGQHLTFIVPAENRRKVDGVWAETVAKHGGIRSTNENITKDGRTISCEWVNTSLVGSDGRVTGVASLAQDITLRQRDKKEKAALEAQLQQAQKMESVGRLAGGVAHDFNNMLGVILGHAELALAQLAPTQPLYHELTEIRVAANRSADLTRQLLAFARKQTVVPKVLDLNETVGAMLTMLRRLISEDIGLVWRPGKNPWRIKVDRSQIDQVLTNLCVNARDAIGGVGKITIETETTIFDAAYCATHPGAVPGEYVRLTVNDDGHGMDKETQSHLFEPYFTTKKLGKGTGLGLATVYGIVKQNNGFITVYSEPNMGTTFTIYLPRHVGGAAQAPVDRGTRPVQRGHETVLLVEDEPALLRLTRRLLQGHGYTVLAASTPVEAMDLAKAHSGTISLLVTDVVMPEMNGRDLARRLRSLYPQLKHLFMSGYTADVIAEHGVLEEGIHFIQKPFSDEHLAAAARDTIDDPN